MPSIEELLKSVFGYDTFLPLQKEIIQNILARRDTLAVMPTGGGKSLCYQLPALLFDGLTVVVSPLISLMKDQVEALTALGIPAVFINSSLSLEASRSNQAQVRAGEAKLLYVAPETLLTERLRDLLDAVKLDCLVIDEAHCISMWGHDFRPEYRQLSAVRRRFPGAVCLALTATATPRVRQDIQSSLKFEAGSEFIASFNRPNLLLEVVSKHNATRQVIDFISQFPKQSGIIYCFSRSQVDRLAESLQKRGFSARPYHAGLDDTVRAANQDAFIHDRTQIIVATIAFGMGINKSNVRFILHHDLPKSIENYYQEIGRAGRDGLPAACRLLYSAADIAKQRYFIDDKQGQERESAEQHLRAIVDYAEGHACRRVPLLAHFDERYTGGNCGMCDNCRRPGRQPVDMTIPAQKFLSCVHRTGGRFGTEHIIDVLLGSSKKRVTELGHDKLSTYGIGAELNRDGWQYLSEQLIEHGLLALENGRYPTLALTPSAYTFFKSKEPFMGFRAPVKPVTSPDIGGADGYDHSLFDLLQEQRRALADAAHVPAYVIFSDRTLIEMSTYYPQSPASLKTMFGIGDRKLEQYGTVFLNLICGYCQQHQIEEKFKPGAHPSDSFTPKPAAFPTVSDRTMEICSAFNTGAELQDLAEEYSVQLGTILGHLSNAQQAGLSLRLYNFLAMVNLPEEQTCRALSAFAELGTQYLRPVFDALNGDVNYDDLKLLRIHYLCNHTPLPSSQTDLTGL